MATTPLDALAEQLRALQQQIATLQAAPPPAPPVTSTAAERIRQYVLSEGHASMPELMRALKLEKSGVHYYARKLAAEGRVTLRYEPHAASHSLVLVASDPALVQVTAKARRAATGTNGNTG